MQGIISSWLYDTEASLTVIPLSEFCKILPDKQPEKICHLTTSARILLLLLELLGFII